VEFFQEVVSWQSEKWLVQGQWEDTRNDPTGQTGCIEIEMVWEDEGRIAVPNTTMTVLSELGLEDATFKHLMDAR